MLKGHTLFIELFFPKIKSKLECCPFCISANVCRLQTTISLPMYHAFEIKLRFICLVRPYILSFLQVLTRVALSGDVYMFVVLKSRKPQKMVIVVRMIDNEKVLEALPSSLSLCYVLSSGLHTALQYLVPGQTSMLLALGFYGICKDSF